MCGATVVVLDEGDDPVGEIVDRVELAAFAQTALQAVAAAFELAGALGSQGPPDRSG
jgi:hypothetical protein